MLGPGPLLLGVLAWTWAWWAGAAATGGATSAGGVVLWLVGACGAPLAVLVELRRREPGARRAFVHRLVAVRNVATRWWLAALAVGAGPKVVALVLTLATGRSISGWGVTLASLPGLVAFLVVAVWIEEPLWRGVALDAALRRTGPMVAALGIGVAWSLWHLPLFWLEGTYQHDLGIGTTAFWRFLLSLPALSVLLTWPVYRSGGAVSLAIAAHFLGNLLGELLPDHPTVANIEAVVTVVSAGGVIALTAKRPTVHHRGGDGTKAEPNRVAARRFGTGRGAVFPVSASWRLDNPLRHLVHPPARLIRRLAPQPGEVILELGCGPGWFSGRLAGAFPIGLVLADLQHEMLALARQRASTVPAIAADAMHLPLRDRSVDAVILATVLGEVPDPAAALREVARVLRPGGRLIVLESRTDPDWVPLARLRTLASAAGLRVERRWGRPGYTARLVHLPHV